MTDMNMQSEINKKFVKNYPVRIFDYRPPANWESDKPIAGKFYSIHKELNPRINYGSDDQNTLPAYFYSTRSKKVETFNQEYGLYREPLLKVDRNDRRFFHPIPSCEITRIEDIIRRVNAKL